jgi:hypothetical protein
MRQVGGFLRVLQFPPPIKTDHHDITEILFQVIEEWLGLGLPLETIFQLYRGGQFLLVEETGAL